MNTLKIYKIVYFLFFFKYTHRAVMIKGATIVEEPPPPPPPHKIAHTIATQAIS